MLALYKEKFVWNNNVTGEFIPSWLKYLDKSMIIGTYVNTCPGFMMVPCKYHPSGNKHHTICCAVSDVLFFLEIVKVKDAP
jgi:hypothetical protein